MTILMERIGLTTKDLMIIKTPIPLIVLSIIYLYFVLKAGPNYMKDRKPYSLARFIQLYNIFQIMVNTLIVYNIIDLGMYKEYFFSCKIPTYEEGVLNERTDNLELSIMYLKAFDYIETVLFVLRKKQRQISFLHLYHHITTVHFSWLMIKYYIPGIYLLFGMINCSVHVMMYTYYFFSSFGPSIQKILNPIKPVITTIQMVQFVILAMYTLQFTILNCSQPATISTLILINTANNGILFYNFYIRNYTKQVKQK